MNYLAHIYLSGDNEEVVVGNFMGDYVKGQDLNNYPKAIKKGLILHRNIDTYTDTHQIVRKCKKCFIQKYRKYAGILIDIIFDHFLTQHWNKFNPEPLDIFVIKVNNILMSYYDIFPERVQFFIPSFIKNNWIKTYSKVEGIDLVLRRMSNRTTLPNETDWAMEQFRKNYKILGQQFMRYFPDIISYVKEKFEINFKE